MENPTVVIVQKLQYDWRCFLSSDSAVYGTGKTVDGAYSNMIRNHGDHFPESQPLIQFAGDDLTQSFATEYIFGDIKVGTPLIKFIGDHEVSRGMVVKFDEHLLIAKFLNHGYEEMYYRSNGRGVLPQDHSRVVYG